MDYILITSAIVGIDLLESVFLSCMCIVTLVAMCWL